MITVYVDVLFFVNFIVNILILEGTASVMREMTKPMRILLGAAVGALYAVLIFFVNIHPFGSFIIKMAVSAVIVYCSFGYRKLGRFLKMITGFYIVSFIFGGTVVALLSLTNLGRKLGAIYSNGAIYITLPWKVLFLSSAAAYGAIVVFSRIRKRKIERAAIKRRLTIYIQGKKIDINAIIDTGNSLCDPITGTPVIVCEYPSLTEILPQEGESLLEKMMNAKLKVRVIPFSSIGKENGVMIGFMPDKTEVDGKETEKCIVGVSENKLSAEEDYHALLNPMLTIRKGYVKNEY